MPAKWGGESDAFTRWRHLLCVFYNNTGLVKYCQRQFNKRERRQARAEIENDLTDWINYYTAYDNQDIPRDRSDLIIAECDEKRCIQQAER